MKKSKWIKSTPKLSAYVVEAGVNAAVERVVVGKGRQAETGKEVRLKMDVIK